MEKIRILLADDHTILRAGLKTALELKEELEVIGEAIDGLQAVQLAGELKPDVIIMDIDMPNLDGIKASRNIKRSHPEIKILLLTMYDNKQFVLDALSNGIDAYLLKMAKLEEVHKAIITIANGDTYFDKNVTSILANKQTKELKYQSDELKNKYGVTDREKEIIYMIASGFTNSEIAKRLTISPNTVNNHRANILRKLDLRNSAELVKFAIENGLSS